MGGWSQLSSRADDEDAPPSGREANATSSPLPALLTPPRRATGNTGPDDEIDDGWERGPATAVPAVPCAAAAAAAAVEKDRRGCAEGEPVSALFASAVLRRSLLVAVVADMASSASGDPGDPTEPDENCLRCLDSPVLARDGGDTADPVAVPDCGCNADDDADAVPEPDPERRPSLDLRRAPAPLVNARAPGDDTSARLRDRRTPLLSNRRSERSRSRARSSPSS